MTRIPSTNAPGFITAALALLLLTACDKSIAGGEADGSRIFAEACSRCHGERGVPPPEMSLQYGVRDLTSDPIQTQLTLPQLRERIAQGKRAMPGFQGTLTDAQIDAVARFVKSLGAADPLDGPLGAPDPQGAPDQ